MDIQMKEWKEFSLTDLFTVDYGNKFDGNKMTQETSERVAFVTRTAKNNGVSMFVDTLDGVEPYPAGCLTVALGGSIGCTFVQTKPFYTGQNVSVLNPLVEMNAEQKLFISTIIQNEAQTKYTAFGRELNKYIKRSFTIKLPVTESGDPDWDMMTSYIRNLPNIKNIWNFIHHNTL